jgi:hypothetical protein
MKTARMVLCLCRTFLTLGYVSLALWILVCPLLWILRDGLGPDARTTTGWAALEKFAPMLLIGLALFCALVLLHLCERWLRLSTQCRGTLRPNEYRFCQCDGSRRAGIAGRFRRPRMVKSCASACCCGRGC